MASRLKARRTVKAFDADIALINQVAREQGCMAADIIHDFCKALKRRIWEQNVRESVESMRSDPKLWAAHLAETKLWDCTSADGLPDEDGDWDAY